MPEISTPVTAGGIPVEEPVDKLVEELDEQAPTETVGGEPIERVSPLDAAILGALDGVKMAVSIAAVLVLIVGLVSLINQLFTGLAGLQKSDIGILQAIGSFFSVVTLANIEGVIFYPITLLTGVPLNESWEAAVIIGRRLTETAIPPYQALAAAGARELNPLSSRTVLIVSYALSGFAHIASVGIFVGGTIALAPSRRKDISALGWKALFVGTLATLMIACIAGFYDNGDPSILGTKQPPAASPSPAATTPASPGAPPTGSPAPTPTGPSPASTVSPTASPGT